MTILPQLLHVLSLILTNQQFFSWTLISHFNHKYSWQLEMVLHYIIILSKYYFSNKI